MQCGRTQWMLSSPVVFVVPEASLLACLLHPVTPDLAEASSPAVLLCPIAADLAEASTPIARVIQLLSSSVHKQSP